MCNHELDCFATLKNLLPELESLVENEKYKVNRQHLKVVKDFMKQYIHNEQDGKFKSG